MERSESLLGSERVGGGDLTRLKDMRAKRGEGSGEIMLYRQDGWQRTIERTLSMMFGHLTTMGTKIQIILH